MALVVNTNVASLVAQKNLGASQSKLDTAMERLSSGSRINSASDDAAGLAIASRMESQVRGLNQAVRNANDGISLAQTAEGAMEEITSMLQRMRELSIQASNGVMTSADRASVDSEITALKSEIDRIVTTTTFNGQVLLDGSFGTSLQLGALSGQTMAIDIANLGTSSLGGISGAGSSQAVRSGSFEGAMATPTKAQMTFEGNDSYKFTLAIGGLGAANNEVYTFNVEGDVIGGSAKDIVDKINAALRDDPAVGVVGAAAATDPAAVVADAAPSVRATYSGNTVTIENLAGGSISFEKGLVTGVAAGVVSRAGDLSASGSNVVYSSVVGGAGTNDNKVVGSSGNTGTSLINNGANPSGGAAGTPAVASTMVLNFATASEAATSSALTDASRVVMTLTSGSEVVTLDTGTVSGVTTLDLLVAELNAALTTSGSNKYTIAKYTADDAAAVVGTNTQNTNNFVITRADGADFTVALHSDTDLKAGAAVELYESKLDINTTTGTPAVDTKIHATGSVDLTIGTLATTWTAATETMVLKLTDSDGVETTLDSGLTDGTQAGIVAAFNTALGNAGVTAYSFSNGSGATGFEITKTDGGSFTVEYVKADSTDTGGNMTISEVIADRQITDGGTGVRTAQNGSLAISASSTGSDTSLMYLDFLGTDTYSLKFADENGANSTSGVSLYYDGTAASLELAAIKLQAEARSMSVTGRTYDFSVTVENGRLKIEEAGGLAFKVTGGGASNNTISTGSGKIMASVATGQNVSGGAAAVLLDDTSYATSAGTSAAGTVTKTDIDFTLSGADTVSFTISDGTATAQVDPASISATGGGTDLAAAMNVALAQAGLDDVMTVTAAGNLAVTVVHSLGREVTIDNFTSTGSQNMKVEAGAVNVSGIAKFLDDRAGAASATLSSVSTSTASLAGDSVDIIDRAIADVNQQRGTLGAAQNRLSHTINNLTNVSVNTAAAQSRIQDADYAVEAANLAKAQIMQQAGTAMLAQANAMQQTVLSLLQ